MSIVKNSPCHGNGPDHCCYVAGEECRYLAKNVAGRKWACGLYIGLGSWQAVHAHEGYQKHVQSEWDKLGVRPDGTPVIESCGAWGPGTYQCCFGETPVVIR